MTLRVGLAASVMRTVEIVAIARGAGFDLLLADTEHTSIGVGDVAQMCIAGGLAGFPVWVRAGGNGPEGLARLVDCGAAGIVVPHVDTAAQARAIADAVRFAPVGRRSIPSPLALHAFRPTPPRTLVTDSEAALTVVAMIESAEGVADVDAIAAVPGIDMLMVGANDLANSLGHLGNLEHPEVADAFAAIAAAAIRAGKDYAVIGLPPALVGPYGTALGASLVIATNDVNLLFDGAVRALAAVRDAA